MSIQTGALILTILLIAGMGVLGAVLCRCFRRGGGA